MQLQRNSPFFTKQRQQQSNRGRNKIIVDEYETLNMCKGNVQRQRQKQQEVLCSYCRLEIPNRLIASHRKVCIRAFQAQIETEDLGKNQYMLGGKTNVETREKIEKPSRLDRNERQQKLQQQQKEGQVLHREKSTKKVAPLLRQSSSIKNATQKLNRSSAKSEKKSARKKRDPHENLAGFQRDSLTASALSQNQLNKKMNNNPHSQSKRKISNKKKTTNIGSSLHFEKDIANKNLRPSSVKKNRGISQNTKNRESSVKKQTGVKQNNPANSAIFLTKSALQESNLKKTSNVYRRNRRNFTQNPLRKPNVTVGDLQSIRQQRVRKEVRKPANVEQQIEGRTKNTEQKSNARNNVSSRQRETIERNDREERPERAQRWGQRQKQRIRQRDRERQRQRVNHQTDNVLHHQHQNQERPNNANRNQRRPRRQRQQPRPQPRRRHHLSEEFDSQQSLFQQQPQMHHHHHHEQGNGQGWTNMNFISHTLNEQFSMLNSQFAMMNQIFANFSNMVPENMMGPGTTEYYFQNPMGNFAFHHNVQTFNNDDESNEDSAGEYSGYDEEQFVQPEQEMGLDEDTIQDIPKRRFNGRLDRQQQCAVCLSDLKNQEFIKILPCAHLFHAECIDEWLRRKASCAVCREKL